MSLFKQTTNRHRAVSVRTMASLLAASAGAVLLATAPVRSIAGQADGRNAVTLGDDDVPSQVVRYQDLNLATDTGAHILLQRIRFAANAVCPYVDNRDVERLTAHNRCVRAAIARAVQEVGSSRLAAVYSEHARHG